VRRQSVAIVDRTVHEPARFREVDRTRGFSRLFHGRAASRNPAQRWLGDPANRGQAQVDDFGRLTRRAVAIGSIVTPVEFGEQAGDPDGIERLVREADPKLVPLTDVAHVDLANESHVLRTDAFASQHRPTLLDHLPVRALDAIEIDSIDRLNQRRRVVVFEVGHEQAQRGSDSRTQRNQRRRNTNLGGEAIRVRRTCPAERNEDELAWSVPALD
jgi:hypothetical protein